MSEETFLIALKENQGIIRKVAISYCKNAGDRDDLIQEITIQLWKSWSSYDDSYKLSTWMYRIALNVAISFYRKTYRRASLKQEVQGDTAFIDSGDDVVISENIKQLYHYISGLDELNRALMLLYLDEYSYEEIAMTLGISKTNVSTKISRIKKQLRKKFN